MILFVVAAIIAIHALGGLDYHPSPAEADMMAGAPPMKRLLALASLARARRLRRDPGADAVAPHAPGFCSACGTASSSRSPGSSRCSSRKVAIYAVPNNGGWYDFGYFLGIVVFGVGARKSATTVYRDRIVRVRG